MLIPLKNDKNIDVNANGYNINNNTEVKIRICAIGYLMS